MKKAEFQRAVIEDLGGMQRDPLNYARYAFPWGKGELKGKQLRKWQVKVLEDISKGLKKGQINNLQEAIQIAIASGHGVGKSALVAMIIMWGLSTHEDTKIVVTANTDTQLRTKTWPEVQKWHRLAINNFMFEVTATAVYSKDKKHEKTWRADAIPNSDHNTESFAGLHNEGKRILVVFDEASAIPNKIWEVTEGALTDENTEIIWLAFGNPTRANGRFNDCFKRLRHRWTSYQIDSRDVEGTNKDQINNWLEDYGEESDFFKVRVRGIFPSTNTRQFISQAIIDKAETMKPTPLEYDFAPVILSCDPAWTGDDDLVIAKRQGVHFEILEVIPKNDDDMLIAHKINRYESDYDADAVFIDVGYGTGIYSCGKAMGRNWKLVDFGGKSNDPSCINKRAEMWEKMRVWLRDGGSLPNDRELIVELGIPETVSRDDGKIKLESKESMKKRGEKSPNKADALALTFAFPVSKKNRNRTVNKRKAIARGSGGWMG
jgi:hypothetical protein